MLKKATSNVLALLPCSRTKSTLRASKGLRPCWIDPSERLRACFFEHPLPLTMRGSSGALIRYWSAIFHRPNLETAFGRKKDAQDIGAHGLIKIVVVTLVVMSHFCILPGAIRACMDFCEPTAVSRFNLGILICFGFRYSSFGFTLKKYDMDHINFSRPTI